MSEILPFSPPKAGDECRKCGRIIDESGICKCDPEWISPAEKRAVDKVSDLNSMLIEIRDFLQHQAKEPYTVIEDKGTVFQCRGCGSKWLNDQEQHHPQCWPAHMIKRISTLLAKDGL